MRLKLPTIAEHHAIRMCNSLVLLLFSLRICGTIVGADTPGNMAELAPVVPDVSNDPAVFVSEKLPNDTRLMATVGNGHVATVIGSDRVHLNGLYNGKEGLSHRARIPSRNNIKLSVKDKNVGFKQLFELNCMKGYFKESWILDDNRRLDMFTYAHRYYTRVLVTEIQFTSSKADIRVNLKNEHGNASEDIEFDKPQSYASDSYKKFPFKSQCGRTKIFENEKYQKVGTEVCVYYTELELGSDMTLKGGDRIFIISSTDKIKAVAKADFDAVLKLVSTKPNELLSQHEKIWEDTWKSESIIVEGNLPLQKAIYGSLYYILSSLPAPARSSFSESAPFFGISPDTLAYGISTVDYEGHNFWDTEIWMYPTILLFWPDRARDLLNYRLRFSETARDLAKEIGCKGVRFPWESAFTGSETVQPGYENVAIYQHHVTADVSHGFRQMVAATRDIEWLKTKFEGRYSTAFDVIREMAEFWVTRCEFNKSTGFHDINRVMPPDEDHWNVSNSVYTNVVAGYSVFFAKYVDHLLNGKSSQLVPDEWVKIAQSFKLPYDPQHKYHPEFDGYKFGETIKQADVVLLGYPLMYKMDPVARRNDLEIYDNVTREDGPAMTWSMHMVGYKELGHNDLAAEYFNRSYAPYIREPFKIWTEVKDPYSGVVNFITGAGGFLQSLINGYMGIRLRMEQMDFNPDLPPKCTRYYLKGIKYLGSVLNVEVVSGAITVETVVIDKKFPLKLTQADKTYQLKAGAKLKLSKGSFTIRTTTPTGCSLPLDQIGIPLSTSDSSRLLNSCFVCLGVLALVFGVPFVLFNGQGFWPSGVVW